MNNLKIYISVLMLSFLAMAWKAPNKNVKEQFWVNGVCEMCQKRIQTAALEVKGVKFANWNIETKILNVVYNPEKCSLDDIKQKVASVGHETQDFKATDEAYNNLHHCCKYERIK